MTIGILDLPPISVVISTRNRPQCVGRAVKSILACEYPRFDLVVVNQGDPRATAEALAPFAGDPRLRLLACPHTGLSCARNIGCRKTLGELIAFTDDDCEVSPEWLSGIAAAFRYDSRIGVVFGTISAPAYDRTAGFITAYQVPAFRVQRHLWRKGYVDGMGACMAIRRQVWTALGGFDEELGAGAAFQAGEDSDIAARALAADWSVGETPEAVVTHHNLHLWISARSVISGYMFGLGAAHAKTLRLGGVAALAPLAQLAWRWAVQRPVADLNHTPPRGDRLKAFLAGFRAGLSTPLADGLFVPKAVTSGQASSGHARLPSRARAKTGNPE